MSKLFSEELLINDVISYMVWGEGASTSCLALKVQQHEELLSNLCQAHVVVRGGYILIVRMMLRFPHSLDKPSVGMSWLVTA